MVEPPSLVAADLKLLTAPQTTEPDIKPWLTQPALVSCAPLLNQPLSADGLSAVPSGVVSTWKRLSTLVTEVMAQPHSAMVVPQPTSCCLPWSYSCAPQVG